MGRRRRKELKVIRKRIPSIFDCPGCGSRSVLVQVDRVSNVALVKCGNCGLSDSFELKQMMKPVDAYNRFVDKFFQEITSERASSRNVNA